ncbi:MAG: Os1348 family NHLP clan protein [Paracoccaceae bacterium]
MSDGEHTHNKHLSLGDVQTIIGRAMVDERFRGEFTRDPEGTLKKLGISTAVEGEVDEKAVNLIKSLAEALDEKNTGASLSDALKKMRESYLDSGDGIIRPRCS